MLALPREEYDWFDVHGRAREERASAASAAAGVPVGTEWEESRRALPRDRSRRRVTEDLTFIRELTEGEGTLASLTNQEVQYRAPAVPGLARLRGAVTQRETTVTAEALIRVTDSLAQGPRRRQHPGLARLHLRASGRRALALPLRHPAQHHRRQRAIGRCNCAIWCDCTSKSSFSRILRDYRPISCSSA